MEGGGVVLYIFHFQKVWLLYIVGVGVSFSPNLLSCIRCHICYNEYENKTSFVCPTTRINICKIRLYFCFWCFLLFQKKSNRLNKNKFILDFFFLYESKRNIILGSKIRNFFFLQILLCPLSWLTCLTCDSGHCLSCMYFPSWTDPEVTTRKRFPSCKK